MPAQQKSRTKRRIFVKTPGGSVVRRYSLKKPGKATCVDTGKSLHGVPRARPNKLAKIPASARNPQRPYGGILTSSAARKRIVAYARNLNQ